MRKLLWLLLIAACSDNPSDPDESVNEQELKFLRLSSSTVVPVKTASFWAVKGRDRKVELDYVGGEDFLEFEVKSNSLLRRPDGSIFQNGDSIRITLRLDDSDRLIVYFEPSGLVFNPLQPAELEIRYARASRDIDRDGDEDERDRALELALRIWKQERAGLPWLPQLTFRLDDDELEAKVLSFTGFAMASN